jgi:hypothetical protein
VNADRRGGRLTTIVATFAFASFFTACLSVLATAAIEWPRKFIAQRSGTVPGSDRNTMMFLIEYQLRDEFRWTPSGDKFWVVYRRLQEWPPPEWTIPGSLGPERIAELPEAGFQVRAGWPFRAFIGEPGVSEPHRHPVPGPRDAAIIGPFTIPTKPLWGGLFANLAIHSAAWVVLLPILWFVALPITMWPFRAVSQRIVRHRRKDNGLCMNCGYDVYDQPSGSKCPECGEARW